MKNAAYEVERLGDERAMVMTASRELLGQVDAVVFDCDGVLIDARESYDSVILKTAALMVEGFGGVRLQLEGLGRAVIPGIRSTGGFNDDWDTTYALTIFSFLASVQATALGKQSVGESNGVSERLRDLVNDFASRNRLAGRASVDSYLRRRSLETEQVRQLRDYLDYPMDGVHSRMTRTFDEMYYGSPLFQRTFGLRTAFWHKEGLIERERVIVTRGVLNRLRRRLKGERIAMATGRPLVSVRHTLGSLLGYFNQDASVYLGDGELDPRLARELQKYRKPSGASLLRASERLRSKTLLYVGDSAEDLLMVRDARKTHDGVLFAGIYGVSLSAQRQMEYFTRKGCDVVAKSVESIPALLERT